jgi:uncharacterized protein YndB with AHSA1/START domain
VTQLTHPITPTRYGTVHRREDDYQLHFARHYPHPVARVWAALTTPAQLAQWFAPGEMALTLGGEIHLTFPDGDGVIDGAITALDPPHLLEFTWTDHDKDLGVVRWELAPEGDGTQLVLIHTIGNAAKDFGLPALAGWTMMLGRLAALLDGQSVPPLGEG